MTSWQFTPYAYLYFFAIIGAWLLTYVAWKMRSTRGATQFGLLTFATSIWTLGYVIGFSSTEPILKLLMLRVEYLGITSTNVCWILFTLAYSHYDEWLNKRTYLLISIIPALTFAQVLTFEYHDLFYHFYDFTTQNGLIVTQRIYGPGFYLWASYSYLILMLCGMILIWAMLRMPESARGQAIAPLLIMATVFISNTLFITGNNPIAPYDPTPLSFAIAGVFFMITLRRYGFLNIVPVAHNLIFKNVDSGVVIIDERTHILDLNPPAEQVLNHTQKAALGKSILDALPESEKLLGAFDEIRETTTELSVRDKIYELHITPMVAQAQKLAGYILMFYDITQRKQSEEKQQNLIDELQTALAQVKELGGLLPICANCKKIRDDDGYWHQVEAYIGAHSNAEFTHGVCPDCMRVLYPQYTPPAK